MASPRPHLAHRTHGLSAAWWGAVILSLAACGPSGEAPAEAAAGPCASGAPGCADDARCVALEGGGHRCECREGFEGDGAQCVDVDACAADPNPCPQDATCVDRPGGFDCRCDAPDRFFNGVVCLPEDGILKEGDLCGPEVSGGLPCKEGTICGWANGGEPRCLGPCAGEGACPQGLACVTFGDPPADYCYPDALAPGPGQRCGDSAPSGSVCQRGLSCHWANGGPSMCLGVCQGDGACPEGFHCVSFGDPSVDRCYPEALAPGAGDACLDAAEAGAVCRKGLACHRVNGGAPMCLGPCAEDGSCEPGFGCARLGEPLICHPDALTGDPGDACGEGVEAGFVCGHPSRCRGGYVDGSTTCALPCADRQSCDPGFRCLEGDDPRCLLECSEVAVLSMVVPIAGEPGADWVISNYVDLDPSEGIADHLGGAQTYDGHAGVDFSLVGAFDAMDAGVDVLAAAGGTVLAVEDGHPDRNTDRRAEGCADVDNYVRLLHPDGSSTVYGHLQRGSIRVAVGEVVAAGDRLGQVGSSGCSTGPHLHLGLQDCLWSALSPFVEDAWSPHALGRLP